MLSLLPHRDRRADWTFWGSTPPERRVLVLDFLLTRSSSTLSGLLLALLLFYCTLDGVSKQAGFAVALCSIGRVHPLVLSFPPDRLQDRTIPVSVVLFQQSPSQVTTKAIQYTTRTCTYANTLGMSVGRILYRPPLRCTASDTILANISRKNA